MSIKSPQEKSGTLHSKSTNPTKRTGRDDGTGALRGEGLSQTSDHTPKLTSGVTNKTKRVRTDVHKTVQPNATVVRNEGGGSQSVEDVSASRVKKI